jgi:hypothetical protein
LPAHIYQLQSWRPRSKRFSDRRPAGIPQRKGLFEQAAATTTPRCSSPKGSTSRRSREGLGRRDTFRGRDVGAGPVDRDVEALERLDAADDPLGGDGAAQLGQVDGLGVGEYDEVDQVLDSAAAFAARVAGVGLSR